MLYTGGGSVSNNYLKIMYCICMYGVCISAYRHVCKCIIMHVVSKFRTYIYIYTTQRQCHKHA